MHDEQVGAILIGLVTAARPIPDSQLNMGREAWEHVHPYGGIGHEGPEGGLPLRLPKEGDVSHHRAVPHRGVDLGAAVELAHMEPGQSTSHSIIPVSPKLSVDVSKEGIGR